MMKSRKLCKPIFFIEKKEVVEPPHMINEPMDIIVIDDKINDPVEDIDLNFAGNTDVFETPDKFWQFIDLLEWRDLSQIPKRYNWQTTVNNKAPNFNELSIASVQSFKNHFGKYFNELKDLITEKGVFSSLERELTDQEQNALLSHIVAKGQIYYATIMSEPYFCGALVSKNKAHDDFEDFLKYIK